MTSPSVFPTSWDLLRDADLSTTVEKSSNESTSHFLNFCFKRPKQVSGGNFVCPAGKNDIVIVALRPVITLHIMYYKWKAMVRLRDTQIHTRQVIQYRSTTCTCISALFLFYPAQLSALKWRITA